MRAYQSMILAAVLLLPVPSMAQDAFFDSISQGAVDYAGTVAVNSALTPDDAPATESKQAAPEPGAGFRRSIELRRQVQRTFVDAMGDRVPAQRARYAEEIGSGRAFAPFQALLERHGLAADDFGDVAAGYFLALWSVIHDTVPSSAEAEAAIAQMRRIVLADPDIVPESDADRQLISDAQGLYAGIVLREQARRAGDPEAGRRLRGLVATRARAQGMDLQALTLTEHGFGIASPQASAAGAAAPD